MNVPFNQPYLSPVTIRGADVLRTLGRNYEACKKAIKKLTGFERIILTPSCTSALEIAALALDIQKGDEVILPSYTYVSTANAFALRGAKLVFIDTRKDHPTLDLDQVERSITGRTRAIVIVHYAGIALEYAQLRAISKKYKVALIEDAAHCFGAKSGKNTIGSIGDFASFSFHETKNISCGQGGALMVNNSLYWERANVAAYCGTDKLDFIEKKVSSYGWKDLGSNSLLAEPLCGILLANLKKSTRINEKRLSIWERYHEELSPLPMETMPHVSGGNGHIFYLVVNDKKERDQLINHLKRKGIESTFHYSPLHLSEYSKKNFGSKKLPNTERFGNCLVRLPLFYQMTVNQQNHVIKSVKEFYIG